MVKKPGKHIPIKCVSKVLIATGFGGLSREYPDYYAKFGQKNVEVIRLDRSCTDVDSHLKKMRETFPKEKPFIICGHSLGGMLTIELLSREKIPNLKGVVLIGSSRKVKEKSGLKFMMKFPWFFLWFFLILLIIAFPITVIAWRKKTYDTYYELFKFLRRDGAKKIHKQYNMTLKKLGTAMKVLQPEIPFLYVGLEKDTLVDDNDLEFTKSMFKNVRVQIIEAKSLHLIEKYDPITVEKIANEAEFLGLIKPKIKDE